MAGALAQTLRLTVRGSSGTVDMVVPVGADIVDLARAYADGVGDPRLPPVATTTGRILAPERALLDLDVQPGDVLVALDDELSPDEDDDTPDQQGELTSRPVGLEVDKAVLCWLGAGVGLVAGVVGALTAAGVERTTCIAFLVLASAAATLSTRVESTALIVTRSAAAPAFAAAAAFAAVYSTAPGGLLLGIAVGGLSAAIAAAVARTGVSREHDEMLMVGLAGGAIIGASAAAMLLMGGPERALWALLLAMAVVIARLLPYLVIDVPDEALLDIDRLAITAWSARERPRGRRRRFIIRPDFVAELVHRGQRMVVAAALLMSVVVGGSGLLLALDPGAGADAIGSRLLVLLGGSALLLISRSYRAAVPRLALRLAAGFALAALGTAVLMERGSFALWWVTIASTLVAFLAMATAVALGRGWRSVRWARLADIAETLSSVLCVAALPVASGLFTFVRQLTS